MAKAQIKKAQIYEEYKKRKDGKELKINKKQKIGIIGLAVMIAAFVAFRVFYQKGAKLLADMYPWNYVALVIIVGLLIWYFLWAKKHGDDDKKVESDADLTQKKPLLTSKQIGLAAAFGGAAFAFRALGIAIPMVPPLIMDPGALMPCLAGMCGGPVVGIIVGIATRYPFRNACRRPSGAADQGYLLVLCLEADNKDRQREEALGSIWRADIPARVLRRAAPVRGRQRLHTQVV